MNRDVRQRGAFSLQRAKNRARSLMLPLLHLSDVRCKFNVFCVGVAMATRKVHWTIGGMKLSTSAV